MKEIIKIEESNISDWMKPELSKLEKNGVVFKQSYRTYKRKNGESKKYFNEITAHYKGKMYYPSSLVSWLKNEKPAVILF